MRKTFALTVAMFATTLSLNANSAQNGLTGIDLGPKITKEGLLHPPKGTPTIVKAVRIPVNDLIFILDSKGRNIIMSGNGRVVVKGNLYDVWNAKLIDDIDDAELLTRLPLNKFDYKISPADLGGFKVGHGKEKAWLFIDPIENLSISALKKISNDSFFTERYTFNVLYFPVYQARSVNAIMQLLCHYDELGDKKTLSSIFDKSYQKLKISKENCSKFEPQLSKDIALSKVFSINAVPTFIAPDGRIMKGLPKNLKNWFLGEKQNNQIKRKNNEIKQ